MVVTVRVWERGRGGEGCGVNGVLGCLEGGSLLVPSSIISRSLGTTLVMNTELLFLCLFLLCWRDGVVLLAVPGDARGGVHGLSVVPCLRW